MCESMCECERYCRFWFRKLLRQGLRVKPICNKNSNCNKMQREHDVTRDVHVAERSLARCPACSSHAIALLFTPYYKTIFTP